MPNYDFEVEYAKSARAACKKCSSKIEKDAVRIGIKIVATEESEGAAAHAAQGVKWHHFKCFPATHGAAWFKKHLPESVAEDVLSRCEGMKSEDREAVAELFKASRGEVPVPEPPGCNDAIQTPEKADSAGKKRKGKAAAEEDAPAAKAAKKTFITEEQTVAIAEEKAKLAGKNAAFLGSLLAKNGLPKTGRKDDLLDRVAENKVLGIPPTCSLCEKVRLKWSKDTGKFSCPGHFDDGAFQRCKGPGADAVIERLPWQDLV